MDVLKPVTYLVYLVVVVVVLDVGPLPCRKWDYIQLRFTFFDDATNHTIRYIRLKQL